VGKPEERGGQDYSDRIENPPSPIIAAYTRVNAHDADSLFASPTSPSQTQSVCSALEKAAENTPPMSKSVRSAMARAESLAKAAKMKNSSNKKKERIERIDLSSNSTMMTNMNMMMMRQMEEMNRGMARRHKEERHKRKREKKRRQKRRDKRNAKRQAMIDLDDHGGKGGGSLSESSSSESSSSSSSNDSSQQDSGYGKGEWRGQSNVGGDKVE
jgi:hypothetical protein